MQGDYNYKRWHFPLCDSGYQTPGLAQEIAETKEYIDRMARIIFAEREARGRL